TGKLIRRVEGVQMAGHLALAPDGKRAAVCSSTRSSIQLIDLDPGKEIGRFRCSQSVMELTFSPDGKTLAAAKSVGDISLWNVASGQPLSVSADPEGYIGELRFTEVDKSLLLIGKDIETRDWRTNRQIWRYELPSHNSPFSGVTLSEDGQ